MKKTGYDILTQLIGWTIIITFLSLSLGVCVWSFKWVLALLGVI